MKITRKLVLNKETVKVLTPDQLGKAAGGSEGPYTPAVDDLPPTYAIGCGDGSGSGGLPSEFCDMIC